MKTDAIVYIVDDDPAVRDSLTLMLEQENLVVRAFASGEEFLAACSGDCPACCAIIDIRMPGMDGMRLQQEMARRGIPLPIIFLTGQGDIPTSVRAIKAGAVDFLTKPVAAADLLASTQAALVESVRIQARTEESHYARERLALLTEREREVLDLAVAGYANKAIASRLGISHRTVEIHRARILKKTGTANLIELARLVEVVRSRR